MPTNILAHPVEADEINNMRDALVALAIQIDAEADEKKRMLLADRYISDGKQLLQKVENIQQRYFDVIEIGIEVSGQMQWLYVTAMKAMQDVYDYGLASIHYKFISDWPELTQWLKKRKEK